MGKSSQSAHQKTLFNVAAKHYVLSIIVIITAGFQLV
jgi:hypothetical protein